MYIAPILLLNLDYEVCFCFAQFRSAMEHSNFLKFYYMKSKYVDNLLTSEWNSRRIIVRNIGCLYSWDGSLEAFSQTSCCIT